ncbi:MAG: hypothetical protein AB7V04_12115, partial [Desulfomonilaceae bacterium]
SWWKYLFLEDKIEPWVVYYLALTDSLDEPTFKRSLERFSFSRGHTNHMLDERIKLKSSLGVIDRGRLTKPSQIFKLLDKMSLESLLYLMAKTTREQTRRIVSDHIIHYRNVRPHMNGSHLKAMGLKPGPIFGEILNYLRDARLDGFTNNIEDEKKLIVEQFSHLKLIEGSKCLDSRTQ